MPSFSGVNGTNVLYEADIAPKQGMKKSEEESSKDGHTVLYGRIAPNFLLVSLERTWIKSGSIGGAVAGRVTDGGRTNLQPRKEESQSTMKKEEGGGKKCKRGRARGKREGRGGGEKIIGGGRGVRRGGTKGGRGSNRARYGHGRRKTNALGLLDYRERGWNEETEEEKVWR